MRYKSKRSRLHMTEKSFRLIKPNRIYSISLPLIGNAIGKRPVECIYTRSEL